MEFLSFTLIHPTFRPDLAVFSVRGSIDTLTAPEFEKKLLSALEGPAPRMILNLRDADYISSAGWGILVMQIKEIREKRGDLVLAGMKADVLEVFNLLELHILLRSFPDVPTAVATAFPPGPELEAHQPLPRGRPADYWEP
jgi:anti-sigma B factor antagonist